MSSWGCPHEIDRVCTKVMQLPCDPGMKGCVLAGRYVFTNSDEKNKRLREKKDRECLSGQKSDHRFYAE